MKIILCNPSVNLVYPHSRKGMYSPLGLLSLATHLEIDHSREVEIEVIDGDVEEISLELFKGADIVGFHINSFNYRNCIELAQKVKEYGSTIIFGGPHATVLWKNIMKNRVFVDYIIINEGEIPLSLLIGKLLGKYNIKFDEIPNLIYRDINNGKKTFKVSLKSYKNSAQDMLIPSRKYLNVDKYIQNYVKAYSKTNNPFKRPSSIYSSKGCLWRDKTNGCIFCARLEKGVVFRDINELWYEVSELKHLYKTDFIWDISDDNLNNESWFKEFVDNKPHHLNDIAFLIYSRVNRITDTIIPYIKKINVYEVYLGFESGDDGILSNTMKGTNVRMAIEASKKLKNAGIFYFPSFVIGLPGESEASLKHTLSFVKQLLDIGSIQRISATILWPAPGSKAFNMLLDNSEYGRWLSGQDDISIRELEKIWISRYTRIDYETAEHYQELINNVLVETKGQRHLDQRS